MKQSSSLKVFLCDLTHNTIILVSDTIPINIGFIGSYIKKCHGNSIEVNLFKYPEVVLDALKKNPNLKGNIKKINDMAIKLMTLLDKTSDAMG